MDMRPIAIALVLASILFETAAFADVVETPPVKITARPPRPLVTEVAAPQKTLLAADPAPSFTPRVAQAVTKSAF
jgi:hypothetical protein